MLQSALTFQRPFPSEGSLIDPVLEDLSSSGGDRL